jgi:hypothetical protein
VPGFDPTAPVPLDEAATLKGSPGAETFRMVRLTESAFAIQLAARKDAAGIFNVLIRAPVAKAQLFVEVTPVVPQVLLGLFPDRTLANRTLRR